VTSLGRRIAALAAAAFAAGSCGKMGPPQAPLRPVPVAVAGLSLERIGDQVTLRFSIPDANLDHSTPVRVDAVEIFGLTQPAAAPAPTAAELAVAAYRIARIEVRSTDQSRAATDTRPAPGDAASYTDTQTTSASASPVVRYYAAAGVAGRRHGPVPHILALPLGELPAAPGGIAVDYSEKEVRLVWTPGSAATHFIVEEVDKAAGKAKRLTPEPVAAAAFAVPTEFGRERCFTVRTVEVTTGVATLGPPSAPTCVTPVDRFPPAPPTALSAFQGEGVIDLLWTASSTADVAGYIVLRAEGPDGTLQPLMTTPIAATQYRDPSVKAGVTYAYQVVAVDGATPPNRSEPSNRFVVTARHP
jgi:hypothetical protein